MGKKIYIIFLMLILSVLALSFNGCKTLQRLPKEESADAQVYIKRCGACHAIPHPARLNFNQWKDKIVVMKDKQMPVITAQDKNKVLSYINAKSNKGFKTYNLRCGRCHIVPDAEDLKSKKWEDLIVVLDGDMPVFSEEERSSIVRYLQNFAKK
jgi:bifunctional N-acetylglucosamine-1-phosphate-uridyltransferase/glucosamine-1-phosphate-acetyltransferase GlmU-like protein